MCSFIHLISVLILVVSGQINGLVHFRKDAIRLSKLIEDYVDSYAENDIISVDAKNSSKSNKNRESIDLEPASWSDISVLVNENRMQRERGTKKPLLTCSDNSSDNIANKRIKRTIESNSNRSNHQNLRKSSRVC